MTNLCLFLYLKTDHFQFWVLNISDMWTRNCELKKFKPFFKVKLHFSRVWEEIIIIWVLLEGPFHWKPFSLETPFHWRPPFIEDPLSLETPKEVSVETPPDFHWRPKIFVGYPQIFIWDPDFLNVETPRFSFQAFLNLDINKLIKE